MHRPLTSRIREIRTLNFWLRVLSKALYFSFLLPLGLCPRTWFLFELPPMWPFLANATFFFGPLPLKAERICIWLLNHEVLSLSVYEVRKGLTLWYPPRPDAGLWRLLLYWQLRALPRIPFLGIAIAPCRLRTSNWLPMGAAIKCH